MVDSEKSVTSKIVPKEAGSGKSKKKSGNPSYMSDTLLLRRVDKYLEERENQDVINKEVMVDDLRNHYKEYSRRNKDAFRIAVFKAFNLAVQSSINAANNMDPPSDMDISSGESESIPDYDEEEYMKDITPLKSTECNNVFFQRKRNGSLPYIQCIQRMVNLNSNTSGPQELINISSDEDDKKETSEKVQAETVKVPNPEKKQVTMARFVPGNRLITPILPKDTVIIRKRKTEAPLPSLVKRQKSEPNSIPTVRFEDFGGNPKVLKTITRLVLHLKHPSIYKILGVSPPRGFLLHGPPGCGKTLLAHAIAGELRVPLVKAAAPELVAGISGESELRIRELFDQALHLAPCILFIDEVDAITPRRDVAQKDMERRIVAQLLTSLDELSQKPEGDQIVVVGATNRPDSLDPAMRRAGRFDREVCLGIPDRKARASILQVMCSRLRLRPDLSLEHIASITPGFVGADLKALTSEAAMAAVNRVLKGKWQINLDKRKQPVVKATGESSTFVGSDTKADHLLEKPNENKTETKINEKSSRDDPDTEKSNGNDPDTEKSEETSVENKETCESLDINTEMSTEHPEINMDIDTKTSNEPNKDENIKINPLGDENDVSVIGEIKNELLQIMCVLHSGPILSDEQLRNLYIEKEDFIEALKSVQPSAKREGFATVPDVTWDDIGSLKDIRGQLQMSILMPVKYPDEFSKLGVTSPTGIMLCGPPGCGKTLLAKAVANEANINFISVKGPELLNMYVGESERAVRQCFQRAQNSQPCVIFFDELDALCPKRSDSIEGSASSRVVNQLLTEMDGVEGRSGVFLMAATNRPDMVDPAVMRPGRFDKILYVGLPSPEDRVDIVKAITKDGTKPPMDNIDLESIVKSDECEGYSGADLSALIKEASVQALTEYIQSGRESSLSVKMHHIKQALAKIRPSVSKQDQRRYDAMRLQYAAPGGIIK